MKNDDRYLKKIIDIITIRSTVLNWEIIVIYAAWKNNDATLRGGGVGQRVTIGIIIDENENAPDISP